VWGGVSQEYLRKLRMRYEGSMAAAEDQCNRQQMLRKKLAAVVRCLSTDLIASLLVLLSLSLLVCVSWLESTMDTMRKKQCWRWYKGPNGS
jgi:hypothetical protein